MFPLLPVPRSSSALPGAYVPGHNNCPSIITTRAVPPCPLFIQNSSPWPESGCPAASSTPSCWRHSSRSCLVGGPTAKTPALQTWGLRRGLAWGGHLCEGHRPHAWLLSTVEFARPAAECADFVGPSSLSKRMVSVSGTKPFGCICDRQSSSLGCLLHVDIWQNDRH